MKINKVGRNQIWRLGKKLKSSVKDLKFVGYELYKNNGAMISQKRYGISNELNFLYIIHPSFCTYRICFLVNKST